MKKINKITCQIIIIRKSKNIDNSLLKLVKTELFIVSFL